MIVKETSVNILSTNARNMKYKEEDLKNKVRVFKSSIFAIQETHYKRKGKFKMHDFIVFESIRKKQRTWGHNAGHSYWTATSTSERVQ